jgi:hypothetical protein
MFIKLTSAERPREDRPASAIYVRVAEISSFEVVNRPYVIESDRWEDSSLVKMRSDGLLHYVRESPEQIMNLILKAERNERRRVKG